MSASSQKVLTVIMFLKVGTLWEIVVIVGRPQDIEHTEATRFFGGEDGDADLRRQIAGAGFSK